ncbi:MAG: N-formylglutamate amidohydrolase [Erythrobacter sp.]|nr:N-formylglutamate amidohydrolase [Erythrobacter sp.]
MTLSSPSGRTSRAAPRQSGTNAAIELVTYSGGEVAPPMQLATGGNDWSQAAFVHAAPRSMPLPVLIAVPHAGRAYPASVLDRLRDPEIAQLRLEDRHVDQLGLALAKATGTGLLVAQAPRAMLDLNRAPDDVDWDMIEGARRRASKPQPNLVATNARARSGLGLVPRRLPGQGEIWRGKLTRAELDRRIENIHRPYHAFLETELRRIRDAWGAALLIDLHSMPPLRRLDYEESAPRIVLGDRFGAACCERLVAHAIRYLADNKCPAAHNRPYSGGYVLDRHASPARNIHALQLEVCRTAYLDDRLAEPSDKLRPLASMLAGLVRELGAETAQIAARQPFAQAAE